jgi:threonine synthase
MSTQERARYVDPLTGKHHELSERRWRSDDGNPMLVTPLPGIGRDDIDAGTRSLWRYRAALPVAIDQPASMGEGCTPLGTYFKLSLQLAR